MLINIKRISSNITQTAWQWYSDIHASKQSQTRNRQISGHFKPRVLATVTASSYSSSSNNREQQFIPEMNINHGIRNIRWCIFIIQHPSSLKHINQDELSKNKFICAASCPHNYQNTQPFSMIRSSKWLAWRDLTKAYHDFEKQEVRKLTNIGAQWWFWCCLALNTRNR